MMLQSNFWYNLNFARFSTAWGLMTNKLFAYVVRLHWILFYIKRRLLSFFLLTSLANSLGAHTLGRAFLHRSGDCKKGNGRDRIVTVCG